MLGITRREFINYSVMPGIGPRLKELFISGFQGVPFFMALVYQAVRLLPPNHPYTNQMNIGKFGIRHVIAEAANNLVFSRNNIDQIILFFTLLFGIGIVIVQIATLCIYFMAGSAMATGVMPNSFEGFFGLLPATDRPHDLAYMFFDLIFGIPNNPDAFFGSCINPIANVVCHNQNGMEMRNYYSEPFTLRMGWPWPIHDGLHMMFYIYNLGLTVVAALILSYFIVTILMETAQTGTAFGKRFNKVWAPLRIVVAFGLLIPYSVQAGGLNSSQYIVLYAAKFGSNFATNGWRIFNNILGDGQNPASRTFNLVSQPTPPEVMGLMQFLFSAATCYELEGLTDDLPPDQTNIMMYAVKDNMSANNYMLIDYDTPYAGAADSLLGFANGDRQVIIRFGRHDDRFNGAERGNVSALCGEMVIPLGDPRIPGSDNPPERAAVTMQAYYFAIVKELWYRTFYGWPPLTNAGSQLSAWNGNPQFNFPLNFAKRYAKWGEDANADKPPPEYKRALQEFYHNDIVSTLTSGETSGLDPSMASDGALAAARFSSRWLVSDEMKEKGWAGAGTWYNKIAEINGILTAATLGIPSPTLFPAAMEGVRQARMGQQKSVSYGERYMPELAKNQDIWAQRLDELPKQSVLWHAFNYWQTDAGTATTHTAPTANPIKDFINSIFGTSGLYSMRTNPDVHPLAQLVGVGRSLIEAATRVLGYAMLGTGAGMTLDTTSGGLAALGVSMMITIATIALTAGFVLYYVLPFLPFVYFFFAVGGWFKAIFEAMVGAPLWALAHIRIDGPGLAGQAAVGGYFLILEIFLRPILIIFGMLASISIFAALVNVLNQTWDLVTSNLSGFDVETELSPTSPRSLLNFFRGPIDEFFFTIIYTVVVYLMGLTSFKLVDIIPASIMRWMGQSVVTFNDQREDAGATLSSTATIGSQQGISQLGQAVQQTTKSMIQSSNSGG